MAVVFRTFNSSKRRAGAGPRRMNENELRPTNISEVSLTRCSMNIRKTIAIVALASSLAGCGAVDLISKGLSYSKAVATDLERDTGVKPEVAQLAQRQSSIGDGDFSEGLYRQAAR